jgi:CheY-like chemotaxis protein
MREGFRVDVYNDPADSLKNFKPHFYDLIILDIIMPDMDGFMLYNQLRKVDPDVKILFLTASEKHLEVLSKERYRRSISISNQYTLRLGKKSKSKIVCRVTH